jgi:phage-related protein
MKYRLEYTYRNKYDDVEIPDKKKFEANSNEKAKRKVEKILKKIEDAMNDPANFSGPSDNPYKVKFVRLVKVMQPEISRTLKLAFHLALFV